MVERFSIIVGGEKCWNVGFIIHVYMATHTRFRSFIMHDMLVIQCAATIVATAGFLKHFEILILCKPPSCTLVWSKISPAIIHPTAKIFPHGKISEELHFIFHNDVNSFYINIRFNCISFLEISTALTWLTSMNKHQFDS